MTEASVNGPSKVHGEDFTLVKSLVSTKGRGQPKLTTFGEYEDVLIRAARRTSKTTHGIKSIDLYGISGRLKRFDPVGLKILNLFKI